MSRSGRDCDALGIVKPIVGGKGYWAKWRKQYHEGAAFCNRRPSRAAVV